MEGADQCSLMLYENVQQSRLLHDFFENRLQFIRENKYPTALTTDATCRFVMYIIPQRFQETYLDIKPLDQPSEYLVPPGEADNTIFGDFNFDGIVFLSSVHTKHSYTQVFRDGKIETVVVLARFVTETKESLLPLIKIQKNLPIRISSYLAMLKRNNIPGPYHLYFRILMAEGLRIETKDIAIAKYDSKGRNKPLVRNNLDFPIFRLEHADVDLSVCLEPFFDILWNTFGFKERPLSL